MYDERFYKTEFSVHIRTSVFPLGQEDPLEQKWQPAVVFLWKIPEQRSLSGYSPSSCKVRHN